MKKIITFLSFLSFCTFLFTSQGCKFGPNDPANTSLDSKEQVAKLLSLANNYFENKAGEDELVTEYNKAKANKEVIEQLDGFFKMIIGSKPSVKIATMLSDYMGQIPYDTAKDLVKEHGGITKMLAADLKNDGGATEGRALMVGVLINYGADPNQITKEGQFDSGMLAKGMEMVGENVDIFSLLTDDNKAAYKAFMKADFNNTFAPQAFRAVYVKLEDQKEKNEFDKLFLSKVYKADDEIELVSRLESYGIDAEAIKNGVFEISPDYKGNIFYVLLAKGMTTTKNTNFVPELAQAFKEVLLNDYEAVAMGKGPENKCVSPFEYMVGKEETFKEAMAYDVLGLTPTMDAIAYCATQLDKEGASALLQRLFNNGVGDTAKAKELINKEDFVKNLAEHKQKQILISLLDFADEEMLESMSDEVETYGNILHMLVEEHVSSDRFVKAISVYETKHKIELLFDLRDGVIDEGLTIPMLYQLLHSEAREEDINIYRDHIFAHLLY